VDLGVFRSTAVQSVSLLAVLPLMALRSPSRTSSVLRFDRTGQQTTLSLPLERSPLRFYAPSTLPVRGIHFPVRSFRPDLSGVASTARSKPRCFGSPVRVGSSAVDLVAGFHTRFGPSTPFLTTLTVCSSPNPVTCFGHTHPWGSCSLLPACCPSRRHSLGPSVRTRRSVPPTRGLSGSRSRPEGQALAPGA
jgi:hypothetical protein